MTDDHPELGSADNSVNAFANELDGLDVAATFANPDARDEYRRSVPYGRDGRPVHDVDQFAAAAGGDGWFTAADLDDGDPA
ncbi:hypothetical protein GS448_15835 [Rhodococcus hoagii]|nr:hypothetical protein [Prescottella equi]MBM4668519.1 hypothetical protein [Prescottella equi]NKV88750.1 hypothetical protein [Prescottella equi]